MKVVFLSALSRQGNLYRGEGIRCGKWYYPFVSEDRSDPKNYFEVTQATLAEFDQNFKAGVLGYKRPLDKDHDGKNRGWVVSTELGECSLYPLFEINDEETRADVDAGKLPFLSCVLHFGYQDPETGKKCNVIESLALTERPYVKRMAEVHRVVDLTENSQNRSCGCNHDLPGDPGKNTPIKGGNPMPDSAGQEPNKDARPDPQAAAKLSEIEAQLAESKKREEAAAAELAEAAKRETAMAARISAIEAESVMREKRSELKELVTNGQITVAQYEKTAALFEQVVNGEKTVKLSEDAEPTPIIDAVLAILSEGQTTVAVDPTRLRPVTPKANLSYDEQLAELAEKIKDEKKITLTEASEIAAAQLAGGRN